MFIDIVNSVGDKFIVESLVWQVLVTWQWVWMGLGSIVGVAGQSKGKLGGIPTASKSISWNKIMNGKPPLDSFYGWYWGG